MGDVYVAGSLFANRFEIENLAGSGGMGTVYRARDRYSGDIVALKLLNRSAGGPDEAERFAREGQILAELHHPGIVSHIAHGQIPDGQRFLAMEWLDGADLGHRLRGGPLPLRDSLRLLDQIADALSFAHQRGILHRDLKPTNLFLIHGDIAQVKILDFGVARRIATSHTMTRTGMVVGTPQYMAPEQARGERNLTPAADLFSLGCILYECLTGDPPFIAEHIAAVLLRILFDEPVPLEERRMGVPAELSALVKRLLAKDAHSRISDAVTLRNELARLGDLTDAVLAPTLEAPEPRAQTFAEKEQGLFSVVLATSPSETSELDATLPRDGVLSASVRQSMLKLIEALGVSAGFLADGTLVITVAGIGSATDQAALAAQAALMLKGHWPEAMVTMATGRGSSQGRIAVGEVVDLAASLQSSVSQPSAPKHMSGIFVDKLSAKLLEGRFLQTLQPGGAVLLNEALDADASRPLLGRPTPCVGRETELGTLDLQLHSCIEESESRVVLITAPPGLGKSRLRHEFIRRVGKQSTPITILQGRAELMNAGSPYGILNATIRHYCGLSSSESLEQQQKQLFMRLTNHVLPDDRDRIVSFMGELCNVPFSVDGRPLLQAARNDPKIMRDCLRRAYLDWLRAECARTPVLMVLDDLQWGDSLSISLLHNALEELSNAPLFLLSFARPEIHENFPKLWQGRNMQEIPLKGLSKKASERLILHALGTSVSSEEISRAIEQSAGNALFLEELIRSLAEGQPEEHSATVIAMLQARIGRLNAGLRRTVRAASLFGQTFWRGGIAAILGLSEKAPEVDRMLAELIDQELIQPHQTSRLPHEEEYAFRHALVRDAAYSLLLPSDLKSGHQGASHYLEKAGETDDMVIGSHAELGGELSRALIFFTQAAEQSFKRYDLEAALSRAESALRCNPAGESLGHLFALQSAVHIWSNNFVTGFELGQRAIELLPKGTKWWCRAVQDLTMISSSMADAGPIYRLADCFKDHRMEHAATLPFVQAVATLVMEIGIMGDRRRARQFLSMAEESCKLIVEDHAAARAYLDSCRTWQILCSEADPWLAYKCGQSSGQYHRLTEDWRTLLIGEIALALTLGELGDTQQGVEAIHKMISLGERLREPFFIFASKVYILYLFGSRPDLHLSVDSKKIIEEMKHSPLNTGEGMAFVASAQFALYEGDQVRAEAEARSAFSAFPIMLAFRLWAFMALINSLRAQGRAAESQIVAREGLELLSQLGGAGFTEVPLRLSASEAFLAAGDIEGAKIELNETLRQVQHRAQNIADPFWKNSYLTRNPACVRAQQLGRDLGISLLSPNREDV